MVVLALVPETILAVASEMGDQAGLALNGARREILVLEPDGDRTERGVVPRLAIGESLVEIADQVRRLVGYGGHGSPRRVVEPFGFLEQHRRRQVVQYPDRLEVGRKEEPARPEDIVAIGILEIA